jgi:hypothetical protein
MARDAFVFPEKEAVVFWSRKAGNTSLTNWIADVVLQNEGGERMRQRAMKQRGDLRIRFHEALDLVQKKKYESYILARDPYGRIVSSFVEKFIRYRDEPMDSLAAVKNFSARTFLQIMEMKGLSGSRHDYAENYPGISFVDFLEFIRARVRAPGEDGEPDLNGHFNTQVPLFFDGRLRYDHVLQLEKMPEAIAPLAARLGTDVPFPHLRSNPAGKGTPDAPADHSQITSMELIRADTVPSAATLLNDHTRGLIREAFEIDFRLLGYDPAAAAAAPR